jgi:hypothetical protein
VDLRVGAGREVEERGSVDFGIGVDGGRQGREGRQDCLFEFLGWGSIGDCEEQGGDLRSGWRSI